MPFRATDTFQKCTSQGSCGRPGGRPGSDHKRKLFPHWSSRVWPGHHVTAESGALLGFPALPSALSPVGPAANGSGANTPASEESQLSPDPSPRPRKGRAGAVYTGPLDVALQPSGHRHSSSSPQRTKEKLLSSTVGRSCIPSGASRSERQPRAKRWQKVCDVVGLSHASFLADSLQIFIEGLLCSSSVPRSDKDALCETRGLCSNWEDQTDTWKPGVLLTPIYAYNTPMCGKMQTTHEDAGYSPNPKEAVEGFWFGPWTVLHVALNALSSQMGPLWSLASFLTLIPLPRIFGPT